MANLDSEYFKRECPNCGEFAYTGYYCLSCKVQSREAVRFIPITDGTRQGLLVGIYKPNGKDIYQVEWDNVFELDELSIDQFAVLSETAATVGQANEALKNSYDVICKKLWELLEKEIRPLAYEIVPKEYDPEFVINHLQLQLNIHMDAKIVLQTLSYIVDGDPGKETMLSWHSRVAHKQNGRSRYLVKMLRSIPEEDIEIGQTGVVEAMYRDRDVLRYDIEFDDKIIKGLVEDVDIEPVILNVLLDNSDKTGDPPQ